MRTLRRLRMAGRHVSWAGITLAGFLLLVTNWIAAPEDARAEATDDRSKRELMVQLEPPESQPATGNDAPRSRNGEEQSSEKAAEESPSKDNVKFKPFMPSEQIPAGGAVSFPADI